jgi:hypothetical protein
MIPRPLTGSTAFPATSNLGGVENQARPHRPLSAPGPPPAPRNLGRGDAERQTGATSRPCSARRGRQIFFQGHLATAPTSLLRRPPAAGRPVPLRHDLRDGSATATASTIDDYRFGVAAVPRLAEQTTPRIDFRRWNGAPRRPRAGPAAGLLRHRTGAGDGGRPAPAPITPVPAQRLFWPTLQPSPALTPVELSPKTFAQTARVRDSG